MDITAARAVIEETHQLVLGYVHNCQSAIRQSESFCSAPTHVIHLGFSISQMRTYRTRSFLTGMDGFNAVCFRLGSHGQSYRPDRSPTELMQMRHRFDIHAEISFNHERGHLHC
jgi:hypothetical protein